MRKSSPIFCVLLAVLLLCSLFSCGSGAGPSATDALTTQSRTETPGTTLSPGTTKEPEPTKAPETTAEPETAVPATTVPVTTEEPRPQDPDVPLGLYVWSQQNGKVFTRIADFGCRWPENDSDYQGQWVSGHWTKDYWNFPGETHLICDTRYFFVLPSAEETVTFANRYWTAGWSKEWEKMWKDAGLDGYKIGYRVRTELNDGTLLYQNILSPDGTIFEMAPYYEVYLFDEVAYPDGQHVTADIVNDNTIYTDMKITLRDHCYDIKEFTLTAFVYKPDNPAYFDRDGNFRGTISANAKIHANNYPPQPPQ